MLFCTKKINKTLIFCHKKVKPKIPNKSLSFFSKFQLKIHKNTTLFSLKNSSSKTLSFFLKISQSKIHKNNFLSLENSTQKYRTKHYFLSSKNSSPITLTHLAGQLTANWTFWRGLWMSIWCTRFYTRPCSASLPRSTLYLRSSSAAALDEPRRRPENRGLSFFFICKKCFRTPKNFFVFLFFRVFKTASSFFIFIGILLDFSGFTQIFLQFIGE